MNVICFGDSNTYGCDPRSWLGGRYDAGGRWVDILAAKTGWAVQNMGANGREIPRTAPDIPPGTDLLIVMLGSNDLLQGRSPEEAAGKLERFLSALSLPREHILLIAPPRMRPGAAGAWPGGWASALPTPETGTSPWPTTAYTSRSRATGLLPPDCWRRSDNVKP